MCMQTSNVSVNMLWKNNRVQLEADPIYTIFCIQIMSIFMFHLSPSLPIDSFEYILSTLHFCFAADVKSAP